MGKLGWYIHRLRAMGLSEVLLRVRERALQATEVKHFTALQSVPSEDFSSSEQFPILPERREVNPESLKALRKECDDISSGKWHVLRGHTLEVSLPPKWHMDYLCGKEVPDRGLAKDLNHRSLPEGIDPRIVWETSRWIQLVRLAQLAWLEQDHSIFSKIIDSLEDWVDENPLGHGINWTSPMEPGIRLINFTWIHALLSGIETDPNLKARLSGLTASIVPSHVWWVWRYHSVGTSANNHLLGELCGLMLAQARWPQCAQYGVPIEKLSDIMNSELLNQFADDGGNREQALHYHLFAWEMGWQSLKAAKFSGCKALPEVAERMARGAYFFSELVAPDEPWDFGDSDDAHITPVFLREKSSLREWQAWMRGEGEGEFIELWFGKAPRSEAGGQKKGDWLYFPQSGYAVMHSGEVMLRLDGSPLGFGSMAAHGHLDALHLSVWLDGKAVLVDPGTGSYFDNREVRDYFLSAEAHNGPCLMKSDDYPNHVGPFLWTEHHRDPTWDFGEDGPRVTLALGEVTISRHVEFKNGLLVVSDEVKNFQGDVACHWQLSPKVKATEEDGRVVITRDHRNISCKATVGSLSLVQSGERTALGCCSEFFRSEEFAAAMKSQTTTRQGSCQLTTEFNLTEKQYEH